MKHALVTGGAGFIGSHLVDRLLDEGWKVTVVDNFDPFYDPAIKENNISTHLLHSNYALHRMDTRDLEGLRKTLHGEYDVIVHFACKAGVRPSIKDPIGYQEVNVRGTQNLLELAKEWGVQQFVYISSSSVYGVNPNVPWSEEDHVLLPISPYASTKVSGELLGHVYSHLYGIRFVGLRYFTVYGPRQRPDLAIHKFIRRMLDGESIPIFGDGSTRRDYTYIDDIVQGTRVAMDYQDTPYELINLGNNRTIGLMEMVHSLEETLGEKAKLEILPMQPGDVPQTYADINKARWLLGYQPNTNFQTGVNQFTEWLGSSVEMENIGLVADAAPEAGTAGVSGVSYTGASSLNYNWQNADRDDEGDELADDAYEAVEDDSDQLVTFVERRDSVRSGGTRAAFTERRQQQWTPYERKIYVDRRQRVLG